MLWKLTFKAGHLGSFQYYMPSNRVYNLQDQLVDVPPALGVAWGMRCQGVACNFLGMVQFFKQSGIHFACKQKHSSRAGI